MAEKEAVFETERPFVCEICSKTYSSKSSLIRHLGIHASEWLSWAQSDSNLRVTTADVPQRILPDDVEAVLHDVKVFVKHGPDDKIYDHNKAIRDRVARGNCFLEVTNKSRSTMCALQAMKKFTGGLGDDDERESGDDSIWQRYFTKDIKETDVVIATKKANGEAAHLSCLQIVGEFILCGGSKNVHLLFKKKGDIDAYRESRYRIASEVCHTVIDFLDSMPQEDRHRPVLKFIAWTKCELDPSEKLHHLNIVPPNVGIQIAKALGLDPVTYDLVQMKELSDRLKQIRLQFNEEGEVLYFLDKLGAVIGLMKRKTTWYIMCRAIREKLKSACTKSTNNPSTFSISESLRLLQRRIGEIQQWLHLDEETTDAWRDLAVKCMKWTLHMLDSGQLSLEEVHDLFPVTWDRFLKDSGETDRFDVKLANTSGACGS